MDPLSLIASVIAVLGLVKSSCKGLQKLNKGRKGPYEIEELLSELTSFQTLLEQIKEFVARKEDLRCVNQLREIVRRGREAIDEINTLIPHTWASTHFLQLSETNRRRVTVFRNGTKLRALKGHLRFLSLGLAAALSLLIA
ncbi:MAG: hypothetical protein Q9213_004872 [Squamulea squamosa]